MTQKELSYVEDAIGHEKNIVCILQNELNSLTDEDLKMFISEEINKHLTKKENLMNKLEEKANE